MRSMCRKQNFGMYDASLLSVLVLVFRALLDNSTFTIFRLSKFAMRKKSDLHSTSDGYDSYRIHPEAPAAPAPARRPL